MVSSEDEAPDAKDSKPDFVDWAEIESSDDDGATVVAGPAPSMLDKTRLDKATADLVKSLKKPLPGSTKLKHLTDPDNAEGGPAKRADISIGTIRLGSFSKQSYIQIEEEDRWRCICSISHGKHPEHGRILRAIFDQAVEGDWGEERIRGAKDVLLE